VPCDFSALYLVVDMSIFIPPGECPSCGEYVPLGARACPGCGADERTGWNDDTRYDGLDLPEDAFDDASDTLRHQATQNTPRRPIFVLVAILLLALMLFWIVR